MNDAAIQIPLNSLSADAVQGVIEAYILREGTDYGHTETDFDTKKDQVLAQLRNGTAAVMFYPATEHVAIETVD